jgi:hypothetical protein
VLDCFRFEVLYTSILDLLIPNFQLKSGQEASQKLS